MALFGSGFDVNTPQDTDAVALGAAEIRDLKTRLKTFFAVMFNLDTGALANPKLTLSLVSSFPASPSLGEVVYHLVDEAAYVYLSSGWQLLVKPALPVGALVWDSGTIASVTTYWANLGGEWKFANGEAVSRSTYATLFAKIGTIYGVGDGATTFNIPDLRDRMAAGAYQDDAGTAKTRMSDGSSLTKTRDYTSHAHSINAPSDYPQDGTNFSPAHILVSSTNNETTRALPPYIALVPVVRVK